MSVRFSFQPPRMNAGLLLHEAANAAEDAVASALLDASQPLVPVDEGVLKRSGRTGRGETGAYVTYGRDDDGEYGVADTASSDQAPSGRTKHAPSNDYVETIHEDMELHHPNGGESKFLERPMHAAHEVMLGAAAIELKRVFE